MLLSLSVSLLLMLLLLLLLFDLDFAPLSGPFIYYLIMEAFWGRDAWYTIAGGCGGGVGSGVGGSSGGWEW